MRRRRRYIKKKARKYSSSRQVVTYMPKGRIPLPPRYRTSFTTFCKTIFPAGLTSGTGIISMNCPLSPFYNNPTLNFYCNPGGTYTINPPAISNDPAGFRSLFTGDVYFGCRVYSSRVDIRVSQINSNDCMEIVLTPTTNVTSIVTRLFEELVQQPYTRYTTTTNARSTQLKNYMSVHTIYGVSKRSIEDDISGNFDFNLTSLSPNKDAWWFVKIQSADADPTTNDIVLETRVTHYAELFWPGYGILGE